MAADARQVSMVPTQMSSEPSDLRDTTPLDPYPRDTHMDEVTLQISSQTPDFTHYNNAGSLVDTGSLPQHSFGHDPTARPSPTMSPLGDVNGYDLSSQAERQPQYGSLPDEKVTPKRQAKRMAPKPVGSRKRIKKDVWQTDYLMQNSESPLGYLNLKVSLNCSSSSLKHGLTCTIACLCTARSMEPLGCRRSRGDL